jgi:hypothetical protein
MMNTASTATAVVVHALCLAPMLYSCSFDPAPMPSGRPREAFGPGRAAMSGVKPSPTDGLDPAAEPGLAPAASTASCPRDCDDGDPCTRDDREAGGQGCEFACSHAAILVPHSGDHCCPAAATSADDADCAPVPACGDGMLDPGEECDGSVGCTARCQRSLDASLIHRYSFEGRSRVAIDTVGDAHGIVIGGMLEDKDMLELRGAPDNAYVELPSGLLSPLASATLEAWFTPTGDANGQRIFDIGNHVSDEEGMAQGTSYWALSPNNIVSGNLLMLINLTPTADGFTDDSALEGPAALRTDTPYHVAAVFDATSHESLLYVDGVLQAGPVAIEGDLSQLDDSNVWLGRSQFDGYPYLSAQLDEFRVYDQALSATAISRSFAAGPNP